MVESPLASSQVARSSAVPVTREMVVNAARRHQAYGAATAVDDMSFTLQPGVTCGWCTGRVRG